MILQVVFVIAAATVEMGNRYAMGREISKLFSHHQVLVGTVFGPKI